MVNESKTVNVNIPAGVFSGAQIAVAGMGPESKDANGNPGNLRVVIDVTPEQYFKRKELDLYGALRLNLLEAWCGCKKEMVLLDGSKVEITVPPRSADGESVTVYGRGFADPFGSGSRGNFIAKFRYKVPDTLTDEQKKLLEKFYDLENKK